MNWIFKNGLMHSNPKLLNIIYNEGLNWLYFKIRFQVPKDFQQVLTTFTREGYRVIAVATRPVLEKFVKVQRMER